MLAHENHSYWGIAGLLVIWPAVVWALFRASGTARALALGAVAFVVLQGFAGPYDPWRGRHFLSSAVVAVPVAAIAADRLARRAVAWQWIAVVLVCITALNTALLRSGARLFPVRYGGVVYDSVWSMDGAAQLARHRPEYADAIREYERLVPSGSSVISAVAPDSPEFVLFGRNLENTVIPLGAERQELTLPVRADYAVFSDRRFRPSPDDRHLGADWWLRRLGRD
jgi:hypothetical protein